MNQTQTEAKYLQPVYILVSDLNYEAKPDEVRMIDRLEWYKTKRFTGRYLTQRITSKKYIELYEQLKREQFYKWYDKQIQKKYNVGEGWQQNRYFMEEVRPTLY